MTENTVKIEQTSGKVQKTIKAKSFDMLSSALATAIFIVLQLFVDVIMENLPEFMANSFTITFLLSLLVEGIFFFAALSVAKLQQIDLYEATDVKKPINGKTILICLAIAIISLFAFSPLSNVFVYSLQKLGYTSELSNISIPNFFAYFVYLILVCVSPAFFEEFLFRGVILNGLKKYGKHMAVFVSAFLFMIMHGGPDQTIHQFILGIIYGYVFIETRSLWATILMHFFNNFYAITVLFISSLSGVVSETTEVLPTWQELGTSLAVGLAMAAIGGYLIFLLIRAIKKTKETKKTIPAELLEGEMTEEKINELKELVKEEKNEENEEKKKVEPENKKRIILLFVTSMVYLVAIWVLTLIDGLI